ncbi:MAG: ABC transporter ATP-binding protein [bacterium]
MSEPVIKVSNLSKSYMLGHQSSGKKYTALRDVIARRAHNLLRTTRDLVAGKQIIQGDDLEEFWALNDVSFEVNQGDVLGIIGRNGAGKSTLLKVLSRITEPTTGKIEIIGRVASLLEVGSGFHPELTGRENVFLNGAILGMSRVEIKRKFDEIVEFAEVEKFLDTPVKRYSSGMYMRLAFAVAAHLEPEILIVDEVLAVGDAAFQKKCLGKMQDVVKGGKTVLFVSHSMEAIARLCTQCLYLSGGKKVLQGETNHVIDAYSARGLQGDREIDLAPFKRRFDSLPYGRFLKLSMPEREDDSAWCYSYGEPIKFNLLFNITKTVINPEIGFAIFSIGGTELISSTTYQDTPLPEIDPGTYLAHVEIAKCCLNPGVYSLSIGMATEGRSIDHIAEVCQIEIMPSEQSIKKGLYKIHAPMTPFTAFSISKI